MKKTARLDLFGMAVALLGVLGNHLFRSVFAYLVNMDPEVFANVCVAVTIIIAYMLQYYHKK